MPQRKQSKSSHGTEREYLDDTPNDSGVQSPLLVPSSRTPAISTPRRNRALPLSPTSPRSESTLGWENHSDANAAAQMLMSNIDGCYVVRDGVISRLPTETRQDRLLPGSNPLRSDEGEGSRIGQTPLKFGLRLTTPRQLKTLLASGLRDKCVVITLEGKQFQDQDLATLMTEMPDLYALRLDDCQSITTDVYARLAAGFPRLQELGVANGNQSAFKPPNIGDLANAKHLRRFALEKFGSLGKDLLEQLPQIGSLRELSLLGCIYGPAIPQALKSMPNLEQLDLRYLRTGTCSIDHEFLQHLTGLKGLFLSGTNCETSLVTSLGKLTKLEVLHVDNISLINLGLPEFADLLNSSAMPCLKELLIEQGYHEEHRVAQDELIVTLKRNRPALRIELGSRRTQRASMSRNDELSSSPGSADLFAKFAQNSKTQDCDADDETEPLYTDNDTEYLDSDSETQFLIEDDNTEFEVGDVLDFF